MGKVSFVGVDLFSGAGGMSIGAIKAGVDVKVAVEIDRFAATTFKLNHPKTCLLNEDVRKIEVDKTLFSESNMMKILFGGPPCQGFSTSNQKTRTKKNDSNWLFKEYLRVARQLRPDWVIVENVKGIIETENGFFFDKIVTGLSKLGYTVNHAVLDSANYGVPQIRNRVFIVGSLHGISYVFPSPTTKKYFSVADAIFDLPTLENGSCYDELDYKTQPENTYQKKIRNKSLKSINNLVTLNNKLVIERYKHIPQGGNWQDIPRKLMNNYRDYNRCHTGIYHRLKADAPSVVIGNYRKNMLIHPIENRGLSVREAARIQSFPDTFRFYGSIGFQQQQVGNSVPPKLAEAVFKQILKMSK